MNNIKKGKIIKLIIYILIPLGLGTLVGFLSGSSNGYTDFVKPPFAPAGILFPIVWTILYILMGISSFIISQSDSPLRSISLKTYFIQLVVNLAWSFIFFKLKLILLAAIWILLLIILVIKMILEFKKVNKFAGYLQIPYLLWLIFALILNISIYILN